MTTWSYTTRMGITGYWLGEDGIGDFPSEDYYNAAQAAHDDTVPNSWHTTGVYPTHHFDTFFYDETGFALELSEGRTLIRQAQSDASLYHSPNTSPTRSRDYETASRFIVSFQEYSQGPKAGLYAFYGYCIVDPTDGGPGGPLGAPGLVTPTPPGPNDKIRPTTPPNQIPTSNEPPPVPPTKPPAVPIPPAGELGSVGVKFPCINDDGSITEVESEADCPPITPISDAIDDFGGDIIEIPQDSEDGQLVTWQPVYPAGIDRPNAIFAWDRAPRNVNTIDSMDDGKDTINELVCVGAQVDGVNLTVTVRDQESIDAIGRYWASENFSFAIDIPTLTAMGNARLTKYRMGSHVVTFEPAVGAPSLPVPWAEFDISDTVRVRASARLRGGFDPTVHTIFGHTLDVQRVNGWDIELDNDTDIEKLVKLYTEEDLG